MNVFINGITSFNNRGCQALFLSLVALMQEEDIGKFVVLSENVEKDKELLPPYIDHNKVRFVEFKLTFIQKLLIHFQSKVKTKRISMIPLSQKTSDAIDSCDLVVSSGGDVYSLDYLRPVFWQSIDSYALKRGKRVAVFGATLGPFDADKYYKKVFFEFLKNLDYVSVREPWSSEYLRSNGYKARVTIHPDVAFCLPLCPVEGLPKKIFENKTIGINVSEYTLGNMDNSFKVLLDFVKLHELTPVLIPHVFDWAIESLDYSVLKRLEKYFVKNNIECFLVKGNHNASELKYIISKLDYLIAGRTHCTIAGFSCGVKTISLAYSKKAYEINRDIFGHDRFVVDSSGFTLEKIVKRGIV